MVNTCSDIQVMRIKKVITKDVLIFRKILLTSSIRNVWRTVRMCIFMSRFKELRRLERVLSCVCA